jgi:hypothetical protein
METPSKYSRAAVTVFLHWKKQANESKNQIQSFNLPLLLPRPKIPRPEAKSATRNEMSLEPQEVYFPRRIGSLLQARTGLTVASGQRQVELYWKTFPGDYA